MKIDETRMLVLGAQILIGFQFRGVFQDLYSQLPATSRYLRVDRRAFVARCQHYAGMPTSRLMSTFVLLGFRPAEP